MKSWNGSVAAIAILWAGCAAAAEQATSPVVALADKYVAEFARRFPEQATFAGMALEHHDRLTDNSLAALQSWQALEDAWSKELAKIDSASLFGKPEWVVLGFLREAVEASRQLRVCRYELWPVNQMSGWTVLTTQLAAIQPVGSEQARREALARWGMLPRYLANELDNLREGLRRGYSTPQANVRLFIQQLDEMLAKPVEQWPLYSPALRDDSPEFKRAWAELLSKEIKPAVERYNQFLKQEYLAKARESIAITANPDGEQCYQASFRSYTTLNRPAKETFELGRREVERNLATALEIGRKDLQANDLPTLLERLKQDPANHFSSRDELLKYARDAVGRAKTHMPQWFSRVPRADIVVEPYPDMLERTASDSYWPAAQDGSRPAMYRITLHPYAETTRSNTEITAFHEAYPGHHLQIALAAERSKAHPIAQLVGNSGFMEGWARYAEALAEEMGLYSSKYALANRRLWPARGMVVDPGIHLFGWTRAQTIKFVAESGRFEDSTAKSLVDRVVMWPGQLTAYDTGALEFFALRKQAQETLGSRFDIREFHAVLLENGAVTLPMLREQVTHWLKSVANPSALALPNERSPQQHRLVSGAIDAKDLGRLRAAGIRHVINLRTAEESKDFDEAQIAAGLGIDYHSLPIKGAESLTRENARKLDELLQQAGDEPTLVHCASGNRVGALIAVREAWIKGQSVDAAVAEGKRWGLTNLESAVRSALEPGAKSK